MPTMCKQAIAVQHERLNKGTTLAVDVIVCSCRNKELQEVGGTETTDPLVKRVTKRLRACSTNAALAVLIINDMLPRMITSDLRDTVDRYYNPAFSEVRCYFSQQPSFTAHSSYRLNVIIAQIVILWMILSASKVLGFLTGPVFVAPAKRFGMRMRSMISASGHEMRISSRPRIIT